MKDILKKPFIIFPGFAETNLEGSLKAEDYAYQRILSSFTTGLILFPFIHFC